MKKSNILDIYAHGKISYIYAHGKISSVQKIHDGLDRGKDEVLAWLDIILKVS